MKSKYVIFLLLLAVLGCTTESRRAAMRGVLDHAQQQNLDYDSITNVDSIALAAEFFDSHGTPNEQMRAHYLLGCAYRDMGEAPRALDLYHKAAECADATATDCNFALLARVHGQMAALFEDYALPRNQLDEERAAYRYAMMGRDTVAALAFLNKQASCYSQLGIDDSVIYYCEEACRRYLEIGDTLRAHTALGPATYAYLERKNYLKAKEYLDKQEYQSTLTGNEPFLEKGQYLLYYHKGVYYAAMHQYDSATIAYRKLIRNGVTPNNVSLGYYGLYSLYSQMGITDSIVKYANQYTYHNGIFVRRLEHSKLQAAQSLYNYTRHQQVAERESARSARLQSAIVFGTLLSISILLLLLFVIYVMRIRSKTRLHLMASSYAMNMLSYQEANSKLHLLKSQQSKDLEQISQLEAECDVLRKTIASQQPDHKEPDEWGLKDTLLNSPIVKHFHKQATLGATVTDSEWHELRKLANELMPHFISVLRDSDYELGPKETNVCILEKLRFANSEQAALLKITDGGVSNIHRRLAQKLFDEKQSAKVFHDIIGSLPY